MKPDDTSAVPPVPSLLEDYKAHEARLQQQMRDLERRRHELRDAAERTASDIVTTARQDIRRIVIKAREDLVALRAQLEAVGCPPDDGFDPTALLSQIPLEGDDRPVERPALAPTLDNYQPEPATFVEPEPPQLELEPRPSAAHEVWAPDRRSALSTTRRGVWADPSVREESKSSAWWKSPRAASALVVAAALAVGAFVLAGSRAGGDAPPPNVRATTPQPVSAPTGSTIPAPEIDPAPQPIAASEEVPALLATPAAAATSSRPLQSITAEVPTDLMVAAAPAVARESTPTTTDPQSRAAEQEILERDRQWFDAFYRGDQAAMAAVAAPGFAFTDQRSSGHVVAMGTAARRSLDKVRVDFAGVGAVLTAQMTERTAGLAGERQIVSMLSGIWTKGDDGWRLMGVRLTTP